MTNHPLFPKEFPLKFPERSIWAKLCAVVLAFVFDGVCAQQASHETIVTAHGCLEAFPGELVHSTYHWCNKTTPLRRVGRRMGRRQGLAGSGRVHRLAQACTKLPRHALDTGAVGSISLVIFDDLAARLVADRSPTLRALLSLLSHSELALLEGSSDSDDGSVVSVLYQKSFSLGP